MICDVAGCNHSAIHGPNRAGDIPHSLADITKAKDLLGYNGDIKIREGLEMAFEFYKV